MRCPEKKENNGKIRYVKMFVSSSYGFLYFATSLPFKGLVVFVFGMERKHLSEKLLNLVQALVNTCVWKTKTYNFLSTVERLY